MKSLVSFSCVLLVASGIALAQPGVTSPPPQGPTAGSGSGTAPTPDAGSGSDEQPQWLPGLPNVTGEETAQAGKLIVSMKRAVELALQQHPTLRQQQAAAEAAYGRKIGVKHKAPSIDDKEAIAAMRGDLLEVMGHASAGGPLVRTESTMLALVKVLADVVARAQRAESVLVTGATATRC